MSALSEIGILIVQTIGSLVLFTFVLRLILQLVRADFYNPISQFVVKFTNPLLIPVRRVIPAVGGIDTASVLIILLLQALTIVLLLSLHGAGFPPPLALFLWSVIGVLALVVSFYFYAVLAGIIISWVAPGSYHPAVALLHQLTEPVMAPFRKLLPAMGGLDLSPILVFLTINVVQVLLRHMAASTGLHPLLVFGI